MRYATVNPVWEMEKERPDLFDATIAGIRDVQRMQIHDHRIATWTDKGRSQIDALFRRGYNARRGQIALDQVLMELDQTNVGAGNPQEAHYLVTTEDMYFGNLNFCFGVSSSAAGRSVQSLARFIRGVRRPKDQTSLARHIARHEYGHLIGMNEISDYDNPDLRGGIYEGHCANTCTIKQVISADETVRLVKGLDFFGADAGFCASCVSRIRHKSLP